MNGIFIIAEAGVNHDGNLADAKLLIDAAAEAGADAVKFQTFRAEKLAVATAPKADYQIQNTDSSESQFEMLKNLELSEEMHDALKEHCLKRGVCFLSTPFDEDSVEFLDKRLQVPLLKIPSGEITNGPLLLKIARTLKPVILSTGMSFLGEIEDALSVLAFGYVQDREPSGIAECRAFFSSRNGQDAIVGKVTLLHCTTEYPAPFNDVNLSVIRTLKSAFGLPVGLSDHTQGIAIPIAAAALGAAVIEKHFTLDRTRPGPDHKASLEPSELKDMVRSIREVERALGLGVKMPTASEAKNAGVVRRSLVAARDVSVGEKFTTKNLSCKRPGDGFSPMGYWDWLGRTAVRAYHANEKIRS